MFSCLFVFVVVVVVVFCCCLFFSVNSFCVNRHCCVISVSLLAVVVERKCPQETGVRASINATVEQV